MKREKRALTWRELERITSTRRVRRRVKEAASDNTLGTDCHAGVTKAAGRTEADSLHQKDQNLSLPKVKGSQKEEPLGHS